MHGHSPLQPVHVGMLTQVDGELGFTIQFWLNLTSPVTGGTASIISDSMGAHFVGIDTSLRLRTRITTGTRLARVCRALLCGPSPEGMRAVSSSCGRLGMDREGHQ